MFTPARLRPVLPSLALMSCSAVAQINTPGAQRIGIFEQIEGEAWVGLAQRVSTAGAATTHLKNGTMLTMGLNTSRDLSQVMARSRAHAGGEIVVR